MATAKGDAGCLYLLEECKAYDRAKGDYKLRRALHAQIVNVAGSGADALEGKKSSSSAPTVLTEFESLSDDEEASAYYRARRAEIHEAYNAQINNQNIK